MRHISSKLWEKPVDYRGCLGDLSGRGIDITAKRGHTTGYDLLLEAVLNLAFSAENGCAEAKLVYHSRDKILLGYKHVEPQ